MPESWRAPLPQGVALEEPVRLCIESDLRPDGSLGREWLVVTDQQLLVFTENGAGPEARWQFPLAELSEPRTDNRVGGGSLEVDRDGTRLELVRFTGARAARFATVAQTLDKWLKGEEAELPPWEESRCPKCGLPLERGTQVCPLCLPRGRTVRRLVGYLAPYWKQAAGLSVLALVHTALGFVPPYLQRPLMDGVLVPTQESSLEYRFALLGLLVLLLLGSHVAGAVISIGRDWLAAWLGNRISHDVRCHLYQHLQLLSLRFFDKRQMGAVISRVNQDTSELQRFLVWGSQDLATNLMLVIGIPIVLLILNWKLTLFVFLPAPLVFLFSASFFKRIRRHFRRFFHRWSRLNAVLNETLNGLRVVKAFAQEPREISRFQGRSDELAIAGVQAERLWAFLFAGLSLLIMAGTLVIWYAGGRSVLLGEMSVGTLVTFLAFVAMFYRPIQYMSMLLSWASRSLTAAERIFEVLDSEPEVHDREDWVRVSTIEGRVEFDQVTFGYERHLPVLKQVSFDVEPGEMIGLVGHSGAGKTTIINLLCRFYQPDEGEIRIDGVPLNRIHPDDLRRQIGLVSQESLLFSGTIADNISYAKPGATYEEIVRAAKVANAHDFILRKPDGYETLIGEGGGGLSGGERQRIAIARAVLHNPRILILDEATSHVDVETEKQIQEAIARLIAGRTTFAIAHRLATLKNAHRLIVLKGGEIAEIGTHAELIEQEGEFHRLVQTYQEISSIAAVER